MHTLRLEVTLSKDMMGPQKLKMGYVTLTMPDGVVCQRKANMAKAPPAGPGGSRPPNVFWCNLGINLHLFECLN